MECSVDAAKVGQMCFSDMLCLLSVRGRSTREWNSAAGESDRDGMEVDAASRRSLTKNDRALMRARRQPGRLWFVVQSSVETKRCSPLGREKERERKVAVAGLK